MGQTKEKVAKVMEAARGGVLFIDEAYAMGQGTYGEEAITKLLGMLTGNISCGSLRGAISLFCRAEQRCRD